MTPEGKVKAAVKVTLSSYPQLYFEMPVMTGYGRTTLDFVGCYNGLFFAIETKTKGKKPTPRQLETIEQMRAAGAAVFVVIGEDDLTHLKLWLESNRPTHDRARVSPAPRSRRQI